MSRAKCVLIVGGSGNIGRMIANKLRDDYKVFATYCRHQTFIRGVTFLPIDVENRNWVKRTLLSVQPEIVIYAAGKNDRDWAEGNARMMEKVHSDGPNTFASSNDIQQPRFIYLSNSYIFDGSRGNYHEGDTILPSTTIGRMKSGGENAMRSKCLNYIIVRSSPVFGRGNGESFTFLDKIRMHLDRGKRIELSSNEIHSFGSANGLADLVVQLVGSGLKNRILHYGGLQKLTEYEFGKLFAKKFGYDSSLILPKATQGQGHTRLDYSLNFSQTVNLLKIKPLLLEESFDLLEKDLIPST